MVYDRIPPASERPELQVPSVRVPERHELTGPEIDKKTADFQSELLRLNPEYIERNNPRMLDPAIARLVREHKQQWISKSAGVMNLREQAEARETVKAKAEQDARDKADKEHLDHARAEIERAKEHRRRLWLNTGGSEAGFDQWWKSKGESEVVESRMRQAEARLAKPSVNY